MQGQQLNQLRGIRACSKLFQSPCLRRISCLSIPKGDTIPSRAWMGLVQPDPRWKAGREGRAVEGTSSTSHEWEEEPVGCFQAWLHSGNDAGQSSVSMSRLRTSRADVVQRTTQRILEVRKDLKDHQVQFLKSLPCFPTSAYSHPLPTSPWLAGSCPCLPFCWSWFLIPAGAVPFAA